MGDLQPDAPIGRGISGVNLYHLFIVVVCLLFLIAPLLLFVHIKGRGLYSACVEPTLCSSTDEFRIFITLAWGALVSLAAASGFLGTILSFFLRQTNSDYVNTGKILQTRVSVFIGIREILVLSFFGIIFGLIMLSLFLGRFLEGNLFPKIDASSWISLSIRGDGWAKVFIWCFLAGFSERLIPNLLDNLVRRVDSTNSGTGVSDPKIESSAGGEKSQTKQDSITVGRI